MKKLIVDLDKRSYPIHIGYGLLDNKELLSDVILAKQVMVVTNETIAPLYLDKVLKSLQDFDCRSVILPDGEQYKTLEIANQIYTSLLENRFNRTATLIALGGGVVGDITGFAAATYQRGINFIQVPTTLLAQVDSSVGGKTGVNHPLGKNMIGAFYQPKSVIADTKTLETLDDRQLSAGIAEIIKYGLIRDPDFFAWLESNMDKLVSRDPESLAYAIECSCRNKAEVVRTDEFESGQRALLNLGHTFAHAIETGTGYGTWLHGEAVAIGMNMAAEFSMRLGYLSQDDVLRSRDLLIKARLPVQVPTDMNTNTFMDLMAVDKKVIDGRLRLVLLKSIGKAIISDDFDINMLEQMLDELTT